MEAIEAAGYRRATTSRSPSTRPRRELYDGRRVPASSGERSRDADRDGRRSTTSWVDAYPIVSIEDPLAEDDWDGWRRLTERARRPGAARRRRPLRDQPRAPRARASRESVANAILIKVNQIGTLTETLEAIELGRRGRLRPRDLPPLGRDRGHHDRRPGRRHERRPDQDRRARARRAHRQVQPAAPHRGGARRGRALRRLGALYRRYAS